MEASDETAVEIGAYADPAWLAARAFEPDTEAVRRRVADRLEQRGGEVVAAVVAAIARDTDAAGAAGRRLQASQADYAGRGVALMARWIRTSTVATQDELVGMGQVHRTAASVTGQITRMVRANLAFRDAVQEILRKEVGPSGGSLELLLALTAGVDGGFCRNLLQMGALFDRRSRAFEEALAAKEAELEHQALHDPLTGLANRVLLFDRLDLACQRLRRHPDRGGIGVAFVDLDDFKLVNDRYGHATGDAVLCDAARRLAASVRPEDTVARLGGDEFVVMCESVLDAAWAVAVEHRIADSLAAPLALDGFTVTLSASIGTAIAFPPECEVERLVHEADHAMYRAKRQRAGGDGHQALSVPGPAALD